MRKISSLLAAASLTTGLALAGASSAWAATDAANLSTGDAKALCERLDNQYKFVIQFKQDLPYAEKAGKLHKEGVSECQNGKPAQGVADLRASIKTMYVAPDTL